MSDVLVRSSGLPGLKRLNLFARVVEKIENYVASLKTNEVITY